MADEDETSLFRDAVRGVRRLHGTTPAGSRVTRPAPRARFSRATRTELPEAPAPPPSPGERSETGSFSRAGIPAAVLRPFRRRQYTIEATLDLHGLTTSQAETRLHAFLCASLDRGRRSVRIIHGKGLRSGERGPVLRQMVHERLKRTSAVRAFLPARAEAGGSGATDVLLHTSGYNRNRR